ncbi:MAG: Na/Pi cotransporter family protein [Magnetococcales bacterium]|nr:Na/Pi cotransporter family protein [Magnetococcales bacterium]
MNLSWSDIAQLITGATLYLYGLEKSFFALNNLHGGSLRKRLATMACDDWCGWLVGVRSGALLLSNRGVLALLGELAAGNLLACRQTMQILLGSLLGTGLLALLLLVTPPEITIAPLAIGSALLYVTTQARWRFAGHLLLGIGVLFLGLETLKMVFVAAPALIDPWIRTWVGVVVVGLLAALFGSAHLVIGLLLPSLALGLVDLPSALALVLAANLGASLPLSLRIRESSAQIKRLFLAHVVFQGAGVLLLGWGLSGVTDALLWLPLSDPWRLMLFHGLFLLLISLIGLPLLRPLVELGNRLLPDPYGTETTELDFTERYWPRYLDDDLLDTPTLALAMARREVGLIASLIEEMLVLVPETLFSADPFLVARLRRMDDRVDEIYRAVTRYLAGIGGATLSNQVADELMAAMTVCNELEAVGDIIETNLAHLAETQLIQRHEFSAEMREALDSYHQTVLSSFRRAADAFLTDDPTLAKEVMAQKESITSLDTQARLDQMRVLRSGAGDFAAYTLQVNLYENFKRIFYHAKRIAKVVARV